MRPPSSLDTRTLWASTMPWLAVDWAGDVSAKSRRGSALLDEIGLGLVEAIGCIGAGGERIRTAVRRWVFSWKPRFCRWHLQVAFAVANAWQVASTATATRNLPSV